MDINVRAFGGEITDESFLNCPEATITANQATLDQCNSVNDASVLGGGTEYVAPSIKGQYINELILGAEYELMADFKVGLNYIHRELPRVIEDISVDGGTLYVIANPGEDFSSQAEDVRNQAMALPEDDPRRAILEYRAFNLDHISDIDKPVRQYDAIQVTANQRFSKNALLLASYTYSRSVGNFPGLFSTETGQLDPNLTSMYDLAELLANRLGPMGLDRPHNLKIDGFRQFDLKDAGIIVLGTSFRAQSGIAQNTLAAHLFYGQGESYILPRGAVARGPVTWEVDVKGTYGRKFGSTKVEGFIDVFNLFNNQEETDADEIYTTQFVNPVVGGDLEDLRHAKGSSAFPDGQNTPTRNLNWGNTSARQAPLSMRFGLRVTF
jgi:hypothetical protein